MSSPIGPIEAKSRSLATAMVNELRSQGGRVICIYPICLGTVINYPYEIWVEHEMILDEDWRKTILTLAQGRCNLDAQQGTGSAGGPAVRRLP